MSVTVLVEPESAGHRFQYVRHIADFAGRTGEVVLLTSAGATDTDQFRTFLGDVDLTVDEVFSSAAPSTLEVAQRVAVLCREADVARVVVMEADQLLKQWWRVARPELRGLSRRPSVIFLVNRYPTRIRLRDRHDLVHLVSKAALVLLGRATGVLRRATCLAGRDNTSRGLVLHRVPDPAICAAHSRDRRQLRRALELPADRRLVGIVGVVDARKCVRLVFDAVLASGADTDLLLAGKLDAEISAWLDGLDPPLRARVILRPGFLADETLDQLVAASDVIAVAQLNKGPSGVMGKALAAQVPVVTAGSEVRAREIAVTGGGVAAELEVNSIAAALAALREFRWPADAAVSPATPDAFAARILGQVQPHKESFMSARANAEWQRWGELDPLYGVASWSGKGCTEARPWTDEEFYALGESDWRDFIDQWRQYGVEPGACVEIGCGAARLTRHMAGFFKHVHGVDVAEGMLAKARPAVAGLSVTLHLSDGVTLPLPDASVDAAFSAHVFQHLDSVADVRANWSEIARVLRPGGTLMVHLPVHLWPGGFAPMERLYALRRTVGDLRAAIQRRRMRSSGATPIMRGHSYAWLGVEHDLRELGFGDVGLRVFRVSSNDGLHPVVLARRPK